MLDVRSGEFSQMFLLDSAVLGNPWEACAAPGLRAAARMCWRFVGCLYCSQGLIQFLSVSPLSCELWCCSMLFCTKEIWQEQKAGSQRRREAVQRRADATHCVTPKSGVWTLRADKGSGPRGSSLRCQSEILSVLSSQRVEPK